MNYDLKQELYIMTQILLDLLLQEETLTVNVFHYIKEGLYHTDFVFYADSGDMAENEKQGSIICIIKEKSHEKMAEPYYKNLFALDLLWDTSFDADNNKKRLLYEFGCERYGCDICIDSADSDELDELYGELKSLPFHKPETLTVDPLKDCGDGQELLRPYDHQIAGEKKRPAPVAFD